MSGSRGEVIKTIDHFSLAQISRSGQCFRMQEAEDGSFTLIAGNHFLKAWQQGRECRFACDEEEFESRWKHYFDLEQDYGEYIRQIDGQDSYLAAAADFGGGIRILWQEPWETLVSFLISQQNNIPRIRRCIQNICEAYGEEMRNAQGGVYYAFPTPEALAALDEDGLKGCNLGYRSKYVVRAAKSVVSGELCLASLAGMSYREAKEALLKLYGVGEKVAECICLFALHHLEAFPVDTHIHQALAGHYGQGFPVERYEGLQGVMQQYIFYYELFGNKEKLREHLS